MAELSRLYLLDASIVFFRYYFSMPDHWAADNGFGTGAVFGYSHWLKRFLLQEKPQAVAACFDESLGTCFRNRLDPNYKCSRPPADEALKFQLDACKQITELMGVPVYFSSEFEADDLIATLALRHRQTGGCSCILSRDKDLLQLLSAGDTLWDYPDGVEQTPQHCLEKFGVLPELMADYQALVGDKIDDIPGVPGLGPKAAQVLLNHFGSIDQLYAGLASVADLKLRGGKQLQAKLHEHRNRVLLNRKLTKIHTKAKLNRRYTIQKRKPQMETLRALTRTLGFEFKAEL